MDSQSKGSSQMSGGRNGRPLAVGFLTEGTYPFYGGGVSTWSDLLLPGLPMVDFHVVAATAQPCATPRYPLPSNVRSLLQIPLWGTAAADAVRREASLGRLVRESVKTFERQVERGFVPPFRVWLEVLFGKEETPNWQACGRAVAEMALFLRKHDYARTFWTLSVWKVYTELVQTYYRPGRAASRVTPEPSVDDIGTTLGWLMALMRPLAAEPQRVAVNHATVAASIGLVGIADRVLYGTPLLLTEHGIYLRERAIAVSADPKYSLFQRYVLVRMAEITAVLCYWYADLLAPVCHFNAKWEVSLGAREDKIRVIYNAVDVERFVPGPKPVDHGDRPSVVMMAGVTPIKDIITLIRSAALVRMEIPDVRFTVYGSLTADPWYVARCRELIQNLGLETTFYLAGHHSRPEAVYLEGDLVALSSISEAFPFTVLEAMACGRPVLATDVGGVAEAIGEAGMVTPPRAPAEMAAAIVKLLRDPRLCADLGAASRERALQHFQIQHLLADYGEAYAELAA